MKRVLRTSLIVLLVLAVIGNAGLLAGVIVTREPAARPLTGDRIAKASKPAIVFIQSDYTITTSMPEPIITDATWNAIFESLRPQIYSGQITSATQLEHVAEQMIMNNPDAYLTGGNSVSDTWDELATGSGFFVTQDGYLITAAHVVSASKSEIRDQIVSYTKDPAFVTDERNTVKKDWAQFSPTDTQVDNLVGFEQRWIQNNVSVDKIDSRYYVGTGASVQAGDNLTSNGLRASVVSIDPTVGGHDVAILKANVTGVPALTLAAADPRLGDATYAIGYPRTAYLQEDVPANQSVPVAVTSGKVLLVAQQPSGWTAWGTSAQFTHGDSGGPVMDAHGDVLGIVSYAEVDAQGKQALGGGFFVPSQYIAADLASQGVKPVASTQDLTPTYYRALAEGDNQWYKPELLLLESIKSQSPFDAYVADDISGTQSQILGGNDKTPPDLTQYVPAASGASGGLIVLVLVTWIGMAIAGRRRRSTPAAVAVTAEAGEPATAEAIPEPLVVAETAPAEPAGAEPVAPEAAAETAQAVAPVAPVRASTIEPETDLVTEPAEVLRESEPVAQSAPSAAEQSETPSDTPIA